jgi:hypothetical protein
MATFRCPECDTDTEVDIPQSGHMLGSGPPLCVRFDCAGCGITLNATTSGSTIWPDRPPRNE